MSHSHWLDRLVVVEALGGGKGNERSYNGNWNFCKAGEFLGPRVPAPPKLLQHTETRSQGYCPALQA
jgi:hypothetical protein